MSERAPEEVADVIGSLVSHAMSEETAIRREIVEIRKLMQGVETQLANGTHRMAQIEFAARSLADHVQIQNGRVDKMEKWRYERELALAKEAGREEVRGEAVITRKQLGIVMASAGAVPTLVATLLALRDFMG